jgi:hypothetical protein
MFHRLVYSSRAVKPFADAELVALLETSRRNNAARGITGMLVYAEGDFLQVQEGSEDHVMLLYEAIEQDSRHKRCQVLSYLPAAERTFADWSMGFRAIDKADLLQREGFVDFFNADMAPQALHTPRNAAQFLLLGFRGLLLDQR